ncbi:MAG: hypothetical protein KatS3mg068_0841 [Candidatus Sericytochromatia bacterium]|nr:MAG: hypothetical protein KatS3mg068_0841 [Candidatus Sericytochromatia bacterium]
MVKKNFLILLFFIHISCSSDLLKNKNNNVPLQSANKSIETKSTPLVLPTFNIPQNIAISGQNFLKKEQYINYLNCALENSKDEKEKENIKKNINIVSNLPNEVTFKPDEEFLKYCQYLVPKINNDINEKILTKSQYINYLNCSLEKSKNDIQKESIKRNIEIVKNSPDNFKFNANIEFLEECSNSF